MTDEAKLNGYSPAPDAIVQELGAVAGVVWGRMWRYAQMTDGVCSASLRRLTSDLGISRPTIIRAIHRLSDSGYLQDLTPNAVKRTHEYRLNLPKSGKETCPESGKETLPDETNLVKKRYQSGKDLIPKESTKDISTKTRSKNKAPPNPQVGELLKQYQELIGYSITAHAKEGAAAKWLLKEEYTTDQILGCWRTMAMEEFWKGKHISLQSVKNRIGPWIKTNGSGNERAHVTQDVELDLPPTVFEQQEQSCQKSD